MTQMKTHGIIGMVHLLPLPGSPLGVSLDLVAERALADAAVLVQGGCHALMMENFGDTPFYPAQVPAHVVAAMTWIAAEIKRRHPLPLGINVLRNDGLGALAVAAATAADFIRVNVLTGARVTDQGLVQGIAHDLQRQRASLGASQIGVLADVDVKHSAALAERPLADEVQDLLLRGMADAVIVSGRGTGARVDLDKLRQVRLAAGAATVLVGSGVTASTLPELMQYADGFIVGSSLKVAGPASGPVDLTKVRELVNAYHHARAAKAQA